MKLVYLVLTVLILAIGVPYTLQDSPLEAQTNLFQSIQKRDLVNSPLAQILEGLKQETLKQPVQGSQQSSLLKSSALTKDLTVASTAIADVQQAINQVFTVVITVLSSVGDTLNSTAVTVQQNVVSPLLSLVNSLAELSVIQSIQQVYIVVLVLQTVLTVANSTLSNLGNITAEGTTIITGVQSVVSSIFDLVLSLLG